MERPSEHATIALSNFTHTCRAHMYTAAFTAPPIRCQSREIVLWHYLPKSWNGQVAADLYEGPVTASLSKCASWKNRYLHVEDNDPVGYKSNKAKAVKVESKIDCVEWPRYSQDLNPLDFSLWEDQGA